MSVRLLCVGDLHLGRRPSRIPQFLRERLAPSELGPARAWLSTVELGVRKRVDAVLLAGDVVDQADDFFEAYRALEAGVSRLAEHGIPCLAVAGNHDVEVLPRLAASIPTFRLLGAGGRWERAEIRGAQGSAVSVVGWSFPEPEVRESPLELPGARLLDVRPSGKPVLGLLHCELDRRQGVHAPVSRRALEASAVDTWLLGHIHRPGRFEGYPQIGYLGSVAGLDPTEVGAHGPWLLETEGPGPARLEHVALAPLRWEAVTLELDERHRPEDAEAKLVERLRALAEEVAGGGLRALGVRVALSGRTASRAGLDALAERTEELWIEHGELLAFVDRLESRLRPAVDLPALAAAGDPAGLMARTLLTLQAGPDHAQRAALLAAARERLQRVGLEPQFRRLPGAELAEAEVAAILEAAALQALGTLLEQRR